jgi:GNAT superfamily N-acetyltransferase
MLMKIYEVQQNEFYISTDKSKLDINIIHDYLCNESYWAKNIPVETVQRSIEGSYCFGLYVTENPITMQIGFARVITDCATFAYLADVFVLESYRGKGLSKWLMKTIMDCQDLQGLRGWMLATRDAHALYEKYGFSLLENTGRFMRLSPFTKYPETNS